RVGGPVHRRQRFTGIRQPRDARTGQAHAAGGPLKEPNAERGLQLRDPGAERLLHHMQALCRPGEVELLRHRHEVLQLTTLRLHPRDRTSRRSTSTVVALALASRTLESVGARAVPLTGSNSDATAEFCFSSRAHRLTVTACSQRTQLTSCSRRPTSASRNSSTGTGSGSTS